MEESDFSARSSKRVPTTPEYEPLGSEILDFSDGSEQQNVPDHGNVEPEEINIPSTALSGTSDLTSVLRYQAQPVPEQIDEHNSSVPTAHSHSLEHECDTRVRRSTRDIKRPKFDDELVDSGIGLHSPANKRRLSERSNSSMSDSSSIHPVTQQGPSTSMLTIDTNIGSVYSNPSESSPVTPYLASPSTWTGKHDVHSEVSLAKPASKRHDLRQRANMISLKDRMAMEDAVQEEEAARIERKRRESRIASKDIRAKEIAAAHDAAEALSLELNDWTAEDDIALVTAITHVGDIQAVHRGILFSRDYTPAEIEERWYQLMYDDALSRQAKKRMQEMHPEHILKIQSRTAFSAREEEILREVKAYQNPSLELMGELIKNHPEEVHSARTPQILLDHWHTMLRLQVADKAQPTAVQPQFERIERNTALCGANVMANPLRAANDLRHLGLRLAKVGVQPVAGIVSDAQLGPGAVATLIGKVVRFVLRRDQLPVTLGRNTTDSAVDVNLSLEGPSSKISRKQAQITMEPSGEFWLKNLSSTSVVVDGKRVEEGLKTRLSNNSIVEFGIIKLTFRPILTPRVQI